MLLQHVITRHLRQISHLQHLAANFPKQENRIQLQMPSKGFKPIKTAGIFCSIALLYYLPETSA